MRSDLQSLEITDAELELLTGLPVPGKSSVPQTRRFFKRTLAIGLSTFLAIAIALLCLYVPAFRIPAAIFAGCAAFTILSLAFEVAEIGAIAMLFALLSGFYGVYTLLSAPLVTILFSLAIAGAATVSVILFVALLPNLVGNLQGNNESGQSAASRLLAYLYPEVVKFNKIIRDIDIFDRLQEAGNPVKLSDREGAIAALKLVKADIIRALKTERILRENPDFRPERFAIDLSAFRSLGLNEQAGEYGKLFDRAVQIAVEVQQQMRELHG